VFSVLAIFDATHMRLLHSKAIITKEVFHAEDSDDTLYYGFLGQVNKNWARVTRRYGNYPKYFIIKDGKMGLDHFS